VVIGAGPQSVEVRVAAVKPAPSQPDNPLFAAILEEVGGPRRMRVVMRKPEADGIAMHLQNMPTARPVTHALMAGLVHALGGRLVEARITRTASHTIYAATVVEGIQGRHVLDARPSDAINLALRVGAPIRVNPAVLEAMQLPESQGGSPGIQWV
jgi:bifunctional DNase/RNase